MFNGGAGGHTSTQIAIRQGGVVPMVTILGGAVPASGAISLASIDVPLRATDARASVAGTLVGVPGGISFDQATGIYTFTRRTAGEAVPLNAVVPFKVDTLGRTAWINVFWYGRNNKAESEQIKADIAASVAFLDPGNRKFLVLGITDGTDEIIGTRQHQRNVQLNADLAAAYPDNFLDIRAWLISLYDPTNPQDVLDHANDIIPSSLRDGYQHFNAAGSQAIANKVVEWIKSRGW